MRRILHATDLSGASRPAFKLAVSMPKTSRGSLTIAVVKAAESSRVDVVVIGTHGRSGMRRLLLGSVAERVIATSPVPVLTVRSRSQE